MTRTTASGRSSFRNEEPGAGSARADAQPDATEALRTSTDVGRPSCVPVDPNVYPAAIEQNPNPRAAVRMPGGTVGAVLNTLNIHVIGRIVPHTGAISSRLLMRLKPGGHE